jgi:two-component system, cell cycle sensor histidine kinase and response regulator CckA
LSLSVKQAGQEAKSRVLVVDDEESVRKFTARTLTDAGYEVTQAADGPEALHIAQRQGPFELCIVDLMMPTMNGDEVARILRCADPDVKVLYFTGYSDRLFKQTTLLSANEAFLDKPVSIDGLLEAVSLLLFGHIRR